MRSKRGRKKKGGTCRKVKKKEEEGKELETIAGRR
jgi:hypothetical protein